MLLKIKYISIFSVLIFINLYIYQVHKNLKVDKDEFYDITKALPARYLKNGTVDYTNYIQKALDGHRKVIFPDFPVLINDKGLNIKSNSILVFKNKSYIYLKATKLGSYEILRLENVKNVEIRNPKIVGDKDKHIGEEGEWGMGIAIRSSSFIKITNPKISNCWGDGIYIGRVNKKNSKGYFIPSNNISITGGELDLNRRNGISITCAISVLIENISITNTLGTLPMAGIDIEPNSKYDFIDDITLNSVTTKNNGCGILIGLRKIVGSSHKTLININNHVDINSTIGLRVGGCETKTNGKTIEGDIYITNSNWEKNKKQSLRINSGQENCPNITVKNVKGNNLREFETVVKKSIKYKNVTTD